VNDFVLIRRNLFRKKLRVILMLVSIMVAFAIFGVLASFERVFYAGQELAAVDRLVTVNKINFTQTLPYAYFNRVRGVDGVREVTHANWFGGYYQEPKNFLAVMAVEPETYMTVYGNELEFTGEAQLAFKRERTAALVGEEAAKKWGWKVGDRVPIGSNIFTQKDGSHSWDFTIAGVVKNKVRQVNTSFMLVRYDYFNDTRSFGTDTIGWLVLRTVSSDVNDRVAKTIDASFANSTAETTTDTEKAFNKAFVAQFGNIALIVTLVVGAAFATILMIIGNTMVMAVRERTREIGVLKALGFSGSRILWLVLAESVALALLGGLPGLGLAAGANFLLREGLANFVPGIALTPGIALLGVALMLALGVLTGLVPALNAMRLKTAIALGRS
jgi:putative ABC transport system permease protein